MGNWTVRQIELLRMWSRKGPRSIKIELKGWLIPEFSGISRRNWLRASSNSRNCWSRRSSTRRSMRNCWRSTRDSRNMLKTTTNKDRASLNPAAPSPHSSTIVILLPIPIKNSPISTFPKRATAINLSLWPSSRRSRSSKSRKTSSLSKNCYHRPGWRIARNCFTTFTTSMRSTTNTSTKWWSMLIR